MCCITIVGFFSWNTNMGGLLALGNQLGRWLVIRTRNIINRTRDVILKLYSQIVIIVVSWYIWLAYGDDSRPQGGTLVEIKGRAGGLGVMRFSTWSNQKDFWNRERKPGSGNYCGGSMGWNRLGEYGTGQWTKHWSHGVLPILVWNLVFTIDLSYLRS